MLCRDVYHCTPPELKDIPVQTLLAHLTCIKMENKAQQAEAMKG